MWSRWVLHQPSSSLLSWRLNNVINRYNIVVLEWFSLVTHPRIMMASKAYASIPSKLCHWTVTKQTLWFLEHGQLAWNLMPHSCSVTMLTISRKKKWAKLNFLVAYSPLSKLKQPWCYTKPKFSWCSIAGISSMIVFQLKIQWCYSAYKNLAFKQILGLPNLAPTKQTQDTLNMLPLRQRRILHGNSNVQGQDRTGSQLSDHAVHEKWSKLKSLGALLLRCPHVSSCADLKSETSFMMALTSGIVCC